MRDHCSPAVFPVLPKQPFFDAFIAAAVYRFPCIPRQPLRPLLSWLTRNNSRAGYVFFRFAHRLCHARPSHLFLNAGAYRFAGFLLGFLLHRTCTMPSRPEQFTSIQDIPGNPRHMPPHLTRPSSSRSPAKLKAQAQAGELARTRTTRITLSLGTDQAYRTRLHILNMKRALKGVQLQSSAPKLDQRQARLREKKCLKLFQLRKAFQAVVTFVSSRGQQTETRWGFSGVQVQHWGSGQQRNRYRSDHRCGWHNTFLRYDDPYR